MSKSTSRINPQDTRCKEIDGNKGDILFYSNVRKDLRRNQNIIPPNIIGMFSISSFFTDP